MKETKEMNPAGRETNRQKVGEDSFPKLLKHVTAASDMAERMIAERLRAGEPTMRLRGLARELRSVRKVLRLYVPDRD